MERKLSVIIPHYNSPKLLEKLLISIPENESIQIIVVDDNTTANLIEYQNVKERYSHRVEFYKNESGVQSAGVCRNIGLDHAEGEWLMFADADDFFMPQMYEEVSRYLDTDYEMVVFCPTSIYLDTGELAKRHIYYEMAINKYLGNPARENLLRVKETKAPWSKMFKRNIIETNHIRFSETPNANDMYFVFVASYYCKKTAISASVIYCVTKNKGSLTTMVSEKAYDALLQETIKCYRFGKEHYSEDDFKQFNFTRGGLLFTAYKRRLGIKKIINTEIILRKEGMPLVADENKNPIKLFRHIVRCTNEESTEKKYYVKSRKEK